MLREISAHIAQTVYAGLPNNKVLQVLTGVSRADVWPDSKFAALGAFIFLRYITLILLDTYT